MTFTRSLTIGFQLLILLASYYVVPINSLNNSVTMAITAHWLDFTVQDHQPYAIVFDYPNATVNRSTCRTELEYLNEYMYTFYIKKVVQDTWFKPKDVEKEKKDKRRLQYTSICTQAVCRDTYQVIVARGCVRICSRRRNRQLSSESDFDISASEKETIKASMEINHNLRHRQLGDKNTTNFNPSALYLLPCLYDRCNYI
jgi:hypothetical protein